MKDLGLVSIIIPTYNRAHLLGETLDSVLAQTYPNWECIVVDDGSTDCTEELVQEYSAEDHRIHYHKRPELKFRGAPGCRNYGIKLSKGLYLMWLDDDDLIAKNKIEAQVCLLRGSSKSVATCPWGRFSNSTDFFQKQYKQIYKNYKHPEMLLNDYGTGEFFPCHSFMVTKDILDSGIRWDESLSINQDGVFFCEIILASNEIYFAKNTCVMYRTHKYNRTSSLKSRKKANDLIKSWQTIEKNIRSSNTSAIDYIFKSKSYAYTRLKETGFKDVIFANAWYFRKFLYQDLVKKIRLK